MRASERMVRFLIKKFDLGELWERSEAHSFEGLFGGRIVALSTEFGSGVHEVGVVYPNGDRDFFTVTVHRRVKMPVRKFKP
jgi:hypothetical protein